MSQTCTASWSADPLRPHRQSSITLALLLLLSSLAGLQYASWKALASTDQDGDGLSYGLEFLLNTQPQDWDSDNDELPDGWEWLHGLDPLDGSTLTSNGAQGDPDGDGLSNKDEYQYAMPNNWDSTSTPNELDNGVWWNGTVPTRNWDEESAMQASQGTGTDGSDEDPMGNICADGMDNDRDGAVDAADSDGDGDADCSSDDDDGDGLIDEDPDGYDTDNDGMNDGWEVANNLDPRSPSNQDGASGDPDGDGLVNLFEYVNPSWTTQNQGVPYYMPGHPSQQRTETESPCNPVLGLGPGGCQSLTAEVDGVTSTNPQSADTDGDGLNDSYEALTLRTDPTASDTDSDGVSDGVEVNGAYGNPPQASDPRDNNTDDDPFDDGDEDIDGDGVVDANETDPTRREDSGDYDGDGIENWEENLTCTLWNIADTDYGGVSDGLERQNLHQTDPCLSTVDFSTNHISYSSLSQTLLVQNVTGFGVGWNDWRPTAPPRQGFYNLSNGSLIPFTYSYTEIVGSEHRIVGVTVPPPGSTTEVLSKNGSWCWNANILAANNVAWCDDDYYDHDLDGLADWEEQAGTWGFTSDPFLWDTDGDTVNDLDEIMNGTDPNEPCDNNRDSDGDGLNDYFENNTGCPMIYVPGMGGNGSLDTYVTDYLTQDTDNGGVADGQEYLDGTNPQNDASDDQNPADTDGDGIPDAVENNTGTDWRNPDTDGGGMTDYEECPPQFWMFNCQGSGQDPWDPTDDIRPTDIVFWANNTTNGTDPFQSHFWRQYTYDEYTGVAFGVNQSLVTWNEMSSGFTDTQWLADPSFHNVTNTWQLTFNQTVNPSSNLPNPYAATQFMMWADPSAGLNHSNWTHDIRVSDVPIDTAMIDSPGIFFPDQVRQNSTAFQGSSYSTEVPSSFYDPNNPESYALNVTDAIISEAGAISAWEKMEALVTWIREGNNTTEPKLNHDGSVIPVGLDLTTFMLHDSLEGTCNEWSITLTMMARLAGLPARQVSGYSSGAWHGTGFQVLGLHHQTWTEVHLQTNPAQGNRDMGWVPFDSCPPAEEVDIIDSVWGPDIIDRNMSGDQIFLNGTLIFTENQSVAVGVVLQLYLVPPEEAANIPGLAATGGRLVGTGISASNGTFSLKGFANEPIRTGFGRLVVQTVASGYVGQGGIANTSWLVNVTDDTNLTIEAPMPVAAPIIGAGANTTLSGRLRLEMLPWIDMPTFDTHTVFLNFTSNISGPISIQTVVQPTGSFEFYLSLDENETQGLRPATIEFPGWHESDLNNASTPIYHARPSNLSFELNVTAAPDLTVTVEGNGANSSLLSVDEPIHLNGTVLSRGHNPVPVSGTLTLQMRENGTGLGFVNITTFTLGPGNWTGNPGNFSINWVMAANQTPIPPGFIDLRVVFEAANIPATDEENLIGYGIRSIVMFEYSLSPVLRGQGTTVFVSMLDHTGSQTTSFNGTYVVEVDGTMVNTTVDPVEEFFDVSWIPDANTAAGDYSWWINYSGSQWYKPNSSNSSLRIQGLADISIIIAQDWTHIGQQTYATGDIRDSVLGTIILLNESQVTLQVERPGSGPSGPGGEPPPPEITMLGQGWVDSLNGTYNISYTIPSHIGSGVYNLTVSCDFQLVAPTGGPYYEMNELGFTDVGIQSEAKLISEISSTVVVVGNQLLVNVSAQDVADSSNLTNAALELVWDWDGPDNGTLSTANVGVDGWARFSPTIDIDVEPGWYDVRIFMADDVSDTLSTPNAGRWLGNETFVNVTVQVPSNISLDPMPTFVTAGTSFMLTGQVLDDVNNSRPFNGTVEVTVFFLNDSSEVLIDSFTTTPNGSFNISVPTDPNGDGVTSGDKTVVVSVLNDTNPFYLTSTGTGMILVKGVTEFTDVSPLIPIIVERGGNVTFGGMLREASDGDRLLSNMTIAGLFHDTWMNESMTNSTGDVDFSFSIPNSHPLGQVELTLFFNGTYPLHSTNRTFSTVTVRSLTVLVINPISDNPVAGGWLNVTGTLLSDNGSGIIDRNGNALLPSLTFRIDGFEDTFTAQNGTVLADGSWRANLILDHDFPRGTHNLTAIYTPTVNDYATANNITTFDSRGYSVLTFTNPLDLDPDRRTIRGENITIDVLLVDNSGAPIENASIIPTIIGHTVSDMMTDANGTATLTFTVDQMQAPGALSIDISFAGIPGTTGVQGDATFTRVVILAPTNLIIDTIEGDLIAGQTVIVNGTLLDEHGQPLLNETGLAAGGIIHLAIDGQDTGSVTIAMSNATTGSFSMVHTLPFDTTPGPHIATVTFLGGFIWVDPMGSGDSLNPEYYLGSVSNATFNVSVPTSIEITSDAGEVERNDLFRVDGILLDIVDRPLDNATLSVTMNGVYLTDVKTDEFGIFSVYYPVPANMSLGPQLVEISFAGDEFHLSSLGQTTFDVYAPTILTIDVPQVAAVGDLVTFQGTVRDNLPMGWLANHTVEIRVNETLLDTVVTDSNGSWSYEWTIPQWLDISNHTVEVFAPATTDGWYREGRANDTIRVVHNAGLDLDADGGGHSTRGGDWNISGRLYDADVVGTPPLVGRTVTITVDGNTGVTVTTDDEGRFQVLLPVDSSASRGSHLIEAAYAGEEDWVAASASVTVYAWADVALEVLDIASPVIRSDSAHPIEITGRIVEVGGSGNVLANLNLQVSWEGEEKVFATDWDNATGHWTIRFTANAPMAEDETILITVEENPSSYLHSASDGAKVFVMVPAAFSFDPLHIDLDSRIIESIVRVTSADTGEPLENVSIEARLMNETTSIAQYGRMTGDDGVFTYSFAAVEPLPPFSDQAAWGRLSIAFNSTSPLLAADDRARLETSPPVIATYEVAENVASGPSTPAMAGGLLLLAGLAAALLHMRKRRTAVEALDDTFAYSAELLMAMDEIREAIFQCYESLCVTLMEHGFLRRDFETVREFELAIREALPIREQALVALDRVFEEARYSSHELGDQHRNAAQQAIEGVRSEIASLEAQGQSIPQR